MANLTQYTDEDKARALAVLRANGGNAKKTARDLQLPRSTIRAWAGLRQSEGKQPADIPLAKLTDAVMDLSRKWIEAAHLALDMATERMRSGETKGVRDLLVGAAVATDKHQLLSGAPTSRSESLHVSLIAPDVLRSHTLGVVERTENGQTRVVQALPGTSVRDTDTNSTSDE